MSDTPIYDSVLIDKTQTCNCGAWAMHDPHDWWSGDQVRRRWRCPGVADPYGRRRGCFS